MAATSKVSRGHLTVVPKEVRRAAGIHEGDILSWTLEDGHLLVVPRHRRKIKDIIGIARKGGDAVKSKRAIQRTGHDVR